MKIVGNLRLKSPVTGSFRVTAPIFDCLRMLYGQLSRTFRFDVLVIYCCRRIRLGIISYEIHLLVTKTKSNNIFCAQNYNTGGSEPKQVPQASMYFAVTKFRVQSSNREVRRRHLRYSHCLASRH